MSELRQIKQRLERFGLTARQAEVYVLLLRQGNLRISEIVRLLKLPRSSVYEILKGLYGLGLAEEIVENSFQVVRAYPVVSLEHKLREHIHDLQQQSDELTSLQKSLEILPSNKQTPPMTVRYYKGRSGARQMFWNSLKTNGIVYVQSEWGRGRYVGIEFYKRFVEESQNRAISERVITNATEQVLESIRQHLGSPVSRTKPEDIRMLPKNSIPIGGETIMYDDIYAHVNLKNNVMSGFEIENREFTSMQRAVFETLWESATPAAKLL